MYTLSNDHPAVGNIPEYLAAAKQIERTPFDRESRASPAHDAGRAPARCTSSVRFLLPVEPRVFPEVLSQIVTRLEQARENRLLQAYALIGGFAVSAWGVSRATQDIDLAVALGTSQPRVLAAHLGATYEAGDADDPLQGAFHLAIENNGQQVPVQLIVLWPKWADVAFEGIETLKVLGCAVPVVNWQALVLMKLYAGGPIDFHDARSIVAVRNPGSEERRSLIAQADGLGVGQEIRVLLDSCP